MNESDFSRQRALPLPLLVSYLLNFRKGTIKDELKRFSEVLHEEPIADSVSTSAFSQARKKLKPSALELLSHQLVGIFQSQFQLRRWNGFRLLAVDGSTLQLPNSANVIDTFGPPPEGASMPLARVSQVYDVLNEVIVNAVIAPRAEGERVLAGEHLLATAANDLLIYDRGYPAFWLFAAHLQQQRDFCARLPLAFSREVESFACGALNSACVRFEPNAEARQQCLDYGLPAEAITLRLVRHTLDNGTVEILATSLTDEAAYPTSWFRHLYHLRWGVEESYKRAKLRVEIENFSGLSALAVKQDFYAKIFVMNMSAILAWVAQAIAERVYAHRRYRYRINFASAISTMKDNIVRLLLGSGPQALLLKLMRSFVKEVEPVRPNRTSPRKARKNKAKKFHPNYKRSR